MAARTFKGGVHPNDGKELTKEKQTLSLLPKGDLVFPMSQHIGAPAKPLVTKGDRVLVGQKIGEEQGVVSACVISSVSGTVKAVEERLTVGGTKTLSVVIENDHKYETVEGLGDQRDYTKLSKGKIREIIKEAGIVGMGGAGFPTHVKYTPKDDSKVEFIIANGAECEPYLTSDYRMMLEEPEKLVTGMKIVLSLFENAKGLIAIEDNKPEAIKKVKSLVEKENRIEVVPVKTKYPQGAERQLTYVLTKRQINFSMLPIDVGCIVSNIDTLISICYAVAHTTPLMRRIVTVSGDAVKKPQNYNVKTGTSFAEIIEDAGGFITQPEKLIAGGPMMGQAMFTLDVPVVKTSSAILAFVKDQKESVPELNCIRCGRCSIACPNLLVPNKLAKLSLHAEYEAFEKLYGLECCECGSCSYVCPSGLHLAQAIKQGKRTVIQNKRKK